MGALVPDIVDVAIQRHMRLLSRGECIVSCTNGPFALQFPKFETGCVNLLAV